MKIDNSQLRALKVDLESSSPRVGRKVARVVRSSGTELERVMKANAPVGATGDLRDSIGVTFYGDGRSGGMSAVVGPTVRYGLYQERGTAKMAAQPFAGPALQAVDPRFTAGITAALEVFE